MPPMALTEAQIVILFIFFDKIQILRPIFGLCRVFYSYDARKHIIKSGFLQLGHIAPCGHRILVDHTNIL